MHASSAIIFRMFSPNFGNFSRVSGLHTQTGLGDLDVQRLCPRTQEIGRLVKLFKEMDNIPPFEHPWEEGNIPNDAGPAPHIRINDRGLICRLEGREVQTADDEVSLGGEGREARLQL